MRIILLALALFISLYVSAQNNYQTISLENGSSYLVGKIDTNALKAEPYNSWYPKNHTDYQVDSTLINPHKEAVNSHKVLLFMGTWCGDSKREVPRFVKILETMDFPSENLKMVALDRRKEHYKKSPSGEEWGLNIIKVPTFIFYKNGKEVNRIVESPIGSLEEDILKIINEESYTPNYSKTLHSD